MMNENKFKSICSLSYEFFKVLKDEYSIYLSSSKKEFMNKFDVFKFYKIINDVNLPRIFYMGETYYLNSYYNLDDIESFIPFLCLNSLVSNLNPLKIGLIEEELSYLKGKYNLNINTNFDREAEVASIVSKSLLNNIPFKVVFKESDSDIVNYLQEETNSEVALCYYSISKQMKGIRNNKDYYCIEDVDYSSVIDYLYDFIGAKVR